MKCEKLEKEKCDLVEDMGVYFEKNEAFSPLSARIFSIMVLIGEKGITFEELLEKLEASKSSISTNLQLLQSTGKITYFTRTGDRKRYFKIAPDQILVRLDEKIEQMRKEKELFEKVHCYKMRYIESNGLSDGDEMGLMFNRHYIKFAEQMLGNLIKLRENISNTINQQ